MSVYPQPYWLCFYYENVRGLRLPETDSLFMYHLSSALCCFCLIVKWRPQLKPSRSKTVAPLKHTWCAPHQIFIDAHFFLTTPSKKSLEIHLPSKCNIFLLSYGLDGERTEEWSGFLLSFGFPRRRKKLSVSYKTRHIIIIEPHDTTEKQGIIENENGGWW